MPQAPRCHRRARGRAARLRQPDLRRGGPRRRGFLTLVGRRVLGVDPGSHRAGWGLLAGDIHRPILVDCGEIRLPAKEPLPRRLHLLRERFERLLERLQPDVAAVESPFHGASARSSLQLAHARGVLLASLAAAGIEVVEHTPAAIKKAVTGNGRAEKAQVQRMVANLLRAEAAASGADLADALAAALCELAVGGFREAVERATPRPQPRRRPPR